MPTAITAKLGIKCKAFYNSATYASPTWVELTCINEWTQNVGWDKADVMSRATRIKQAVKTLLGLSWSGKVKVGDADTGYQNLMTLLVSDGAMDFMILNGDKTQNGAIGYRCDCQVMSANEDQGTGAVLYDDVEIVPTPTVNLPASVLVTTGAPVFTTLTF